MQDSSSHDAPAIFKVGLTGGIGAGKSKVSALLKKNGILVIDLDQLGHELLEKDPRTHLFLRNTFGSQAMTSQGRPDRRFLREAVFADPEKRSQLERFLHPLIRNEFERRAQFAAESGHRLVVCEAALLIEAGYADALDELVVVMADKRTRLKRVLARDGVSAELAEEMMRAQTSDTVRREKADFLIENEGPESALEVQIDTLRERWRQLGWL